jgi:hypothetical protein
MMSGEARHARTTARRARTMARRAQEATARRDQATAARRAQTLGQANGASLDLGHGGNENLKKNTKCWEFLPMVQQRLLMKNRC